MTPDQYIELASAIYELETAAMHYGMSLGFGSDDREERNEELRITHQKVYDLLDNITFRTKGE